MKIGADEQSCIYLNGTRLGEFKIMSARTAEDFYCHKTFLNVVFVGINKNSILNLDLFAKFEREDTVILVFRADFKRSIRLFHLFP